MSRQNEAKRNQNYNPKPVPRVCSNCEHYKSDMVEKEGAYGYGSYFDEKNKRCGIGKFAVKKNGTCDVFELSSAR